MTGESAVICQYGWWFATTKMQLCILQPSKIFGLKLKQSWNKSKKKAQGSLAHLIIITDLRKGSHNGQLSDLQGSQGIFDLVIHFSSFSVFSSMLAIIVS